MGGTYGEEVCLVAGVDKNKPAADLDPAEIERVLQALREVFLDETLDPHIVLDEGEPVDVLSRPLKIYEGLEKKRFATFSEALDAFFVEKEGDEEEKKNPLDRRIDVQQKAIEEFESQEKAFVCKGELVYQIYGSVEQILHVVAEAKAKGFSYNQIWERISGSGLPQAKTILSLDGQGEMRVLLDGVELEAACRPDRSPECAEVLREGQGDGQKSERRKRSPGHHEAATGGKGRAQEDPPGFLSQEEEAQVV